MAIKILVNNNCKCHYEIIESVIVNVKEMFKIEPQARVALFLNVVGNVPFRRYIKSKYPTVQFKQINDYNHCVECTVYDRNIKSCTNPKKRYIAHEVTPKLLENPLVYFLTPLAHHNVITANVLPYSNNVKRGQLPIYIIQGSLDRRNHVLLDKILSAEYNNKFIVKLVGRGRLPKVLEKHKHKLVLKTNLDFVQYHKEFLDAYCILPLLSIETHRHYYTRKLTSSINYASGYNLKCLIDKDLQNIYNLKNAEVFTNGDDIVDAFQKTLCDFYNS